MDEKTLARFFAKVDKNGPIPEHRPELGRCHIWTASAKHAGRGSFWFEGKSITAYHFSFFVAHGRWPHPCALHHCDGGAIGCVRWDHLFEGDRTDNHRDMVSKNRHRFGAQHGMAKYSKDQVAAVLELAKSDSNQSAVARALGLPRRHVAKIITGELWSHPEALK